MTNIEAPPSAPQKIKRVSGKQKTDTVDQKSDPVQDLPYPHLNSVARELMGQSNADRIRAIQQGSWLPLPHAKEAIERMEMLLDYPTVTRMPSLLLVGASFSGKSTILERFLSLHPPDVDPTSEIMTCPVVMIDAPPKPDIADFYSRILDALMAKYQSRAASYEKYSQIKLMFRQLGVKMLIIDEIHHLIAGSLNRQREFRNALKSLSNETKVCLVAAGIDEAYNAFNADPQMSSRFIPLRLPSWRTDQNTGILLATLQKRIPVKYPSDLDSPESLLTIVNRAEGSLGDIFDLVKAAAIKAIETGEEKISLKLIKGIDWVPPSRRKNYRPPL